MLELFQILLEGKNVPEAKIRKYASDFSGVALLSMLGAMGDRLNDKDKADLGQVLEMNDYDEALEIIRRKMTPEEYVALVREEVSPLYKSYVANVLAE